VGLESLLLHVYRQLPPFTCAALPLLLYFMLERLPKVGEGVLKGGPVETHLELGGIDERLGVEGVEVISGTQIGPAGSLLVPGKPREPGVL
jgi:hypothetical protein